MPVGPGMRGPALGTTVMAGLPKDGAGDTLIEELVDCAIDTLPELDIRSATKQSPALRLMTC